ncbi:MAG: hypothetical protein RQ745_12785 [Longimicrobiales bacterium]|nr:hypothetical protein [Longimicrobiales bacterium]
MTLHPSCWATFAILTCVGLPASAQSIEITHVWEAEAPVPWLSGLASVGDEYWALDAFRAQIERIARDGAWIGTVDLPGVGSPLLMGQGPGGVAIYDGDTRTIHVVAEGRPTARHEVPSTVFFPKDLLPLEDRVVLAGGLEGDSHALHILRRGAPPTHTLRYAEARQPLISRMAAGGVLWSDGSEVLFAQASPYLVGRLRVGERDDIGLDTIASYPGTLPFVGDALVRQDGGGSQVRWFFRQARGIVRLADGTYLHVIRDREADTSLWEILAPDGRVLASREFDRAYDVWEVLEDGTLLASWYVDGPEALPVRIRLRLTGGA